jgi:hypothetical protein
MEIACARKNFGVLWMNYDDAVVVMELGSSLER